MTGVFGRDVRMYTGPGADAATAMSRVALTPSHGYSTVQFGTPRAIARSSSAICDGPSSPIDTPACDPASLMLRFEMPAMRMKSLARSRKHANVDGNGIAPRAASPIAAPIITCSAM